MKRIINGLLAYAGLKVIRLPRKRVSGQYLFEDIHKILGTETPLCLDVGANVGQTIAQLLECFRSPSIHAFEPSAATFSILAGKTYPASVQLHSLALGAGAGNRRFFNYEDSRLSSFLALDGNGSNPFQFVGTQSEEEVTVDTVDLFSRRLKIDSIDLLKIDTQGFDLEVLKGAESSLANGKIRCVLIEMNFVPLYEGQAKAIDVIEYLAARNMRLVDFYEKELQGFHLAWCTALFVNGRHSAASQDVR